MPRKLPWLKSSNIAQATSPATSPNPRVKRRRLVEAGSDVSNIEGSPSKRLGSQNVISSPLPALKQSTEIGSPMIEGFDHDDGFRMVEDEFLDMAKQFTQHLHAAEYQRMRKVAKRQNEATIGSILRPVTIKMPDETRRKVEGVARARKQATTIQDLLGKHARGSGSDEESNGNGSKWVGTALHGLMESPRRSKTSLSKISKTRVPTRAAAGFLEARSQRSRHLKLSDLTFPDTDISPVAKPESSTASTDESSEEDDDDLDAPVRARKVQTANPPTSHYNKGMSLTTQQEVRDKKILAHVPYQTTSSEVKSHSLKRTRPDASMAARERIAKRLEQAKLRDTQQKEAKLDIIPSFLS